MLKNYKLTENSSFNSNHNDLGTEYLDVYSSPFTCPLTGLEMNGKYKFCAIWTCGCVLSDRALRSINNNNNSEEKLSCPKCGQEYFSNDDVIILNPEDEDVILMEQRRERLAANQKKNGTNKRKSPDGGEEEKHGKKTKIGKLFYFYYLFIYSNFFSFRIDSYSFINNDKNCSNNNKIKDSTGSDYIRFIQIIIYNKRCGEKERKE